MEFQLSKAASQDLEDIYLYGYIHFGEKQADLYAGLLEDRIDIICKNPKIGRIDSRINPAIRRFECESHVIFYDVKEDHIVIVRILHGATDYVQHMKI
jgi:toxin ParE1/3/4